MGRLASFQEPPRGGVSCLTVVSPELLAVGHVSGLLLIYNVSLGSILRQLFHGDGVMIRMVALPGGNIAISSSRYIRILNVATGEVIRTLTEYPGSIAITSLALLHGSPLLLASAYVNTVSVWDVGTGAQTATLAPHTSLVMSLAALPGGGVAVGCDSGDIALWSSAGLRTGTLEYPHGGPVSALLLLPDGRLAAGRHPPNNSVQIWDLTTGRCDVNLENHVDAVTDLAILPYGYLLSCSYDGRINVWGHSALRLRGGDFTTIQPVMTLGQGEFGERGPEKISLAVLKDGSGRVASGSSDGTIQFWA